MIFQLFYDRALSISHFQSFHCSWFSLCIKYMLVSYSNKQTSAVKECTVHLNLGKSKGQKRYICTTLNGLQQPSTHYQVMSRAFLLKFEKKRKYFLKDSSPFWEVCIFTISARIMWEDGFHSHVCELNVKLKPAADEFSLAKWLEAGENSYHGCVQNY